MFSGLKLYTVHVKPGSDHTLDKPIFLREGFNWFAFLFTFLWALSQRLWLFGALLFAANLAVMMVLKAGYLDQISAVLIQFALQFVAGFHGNDVLRRRLQKRGYSFQDITSGDSILRAEQRYFDRLVARAA